MIKRIIATIHSIWYTPGIGLLAYAPWRGPLGVHYTYTGGACTKWWGYNPIMWLLHYYHARHNPLVKAAFLYVRAGKRRHAVVVDAYIQSHKE